MLPKKERFTTADFSKIKSNLKFKKLNTLYGFFIIYEKGVKKAIILSKKNFKTAVERNKIKRLFYNTILDIQNEQEKSEVIIKNKSFVFHSKKSFTKEELKKDLKQIIN